MESGLIAGESVVGGMLTVSANVLGDVESGMVTYYAYISYQDPTSGTMASVVADITFTQIVSGVQGESPIVMTLYAPEGNVFLNGVGELPLQASAYKGTMDIADEATFAWYAFASGSWALITGETADRLLVSSEAVPGLCSFRCEMVYDGETYVDTLSMMDRTDSYQAVIESSNGDVFVDGNGDTILTCRLFQSGTEIDLVKPAPVTEAPPVIPKGGDLWYRIIRPNTVALCRYDGDQGRWMVLDPASRSEMKYSWYRMDKDGQVVDSSPWQVGKLVHVDVSEIDTKTTYKVEVDHW